MSNRTHTYNGYETTTTGPLAIGATSVQVTSAAGLVAPLYLVMDPDVPAKREWVRVNTINGNTLENIVRNQEGSVGDVEHAAGAKVRAVFTAMFQDDVFDDVEALEQADLDHVNASDPHPGYQTANEADARYLQLSGANSPTAAISWGNQRITNLGNPTAGGDAANLDRVQSEVSGHDLNASAHAGVFLPLTGGSLTGPVDMGGNRITSLDTPLANDDAATKLYVDNTVGGLPPSFGGAHDDLTGVTADQHHTKYTDAEAVSAMGAVGNANPLHHNRYTDGEAVNAMGGISPNNPLNHDRYTDAAAVAAVATADDYVKNTGDTITTLTVLDGGSVAAPGLRVEGAGSGVYHIGTFTGLAHAGNAVIVGNGTNQVYVSGIVAGTGDDVQASGTQLVKVVSSRRFKEVGKRLDKSAIADALRRLPVYEFRFKGSDEEHIGWMAEDVAEVHPALVNWDSDGRPRSIRTLAVLSVLT